jgi:hypothetical protein
MAGRTGKSKTKKANDDDEPDRNVVTPDQLLSTLRSQQKPTSQALALKNVSEYDYEDEETIPGLVALPRKGPDLEGFNDLRMVELAEAAYVDTDPVPPTAELTSFAEREVDELRMKAMAKMRRPVPKLDTPDVSPAPTPPPSVGEKFARDVILDRNPDGPHTMDQLDDWLRASSCTDYDGDWRPLWRTTEREKGKKSEEEVILETERKSWFPPALDKNVFSQEGAGVMLHFMLITRLGAALLCNAIMTTPLLVANLGGSLLLTNTFLGFGRMTIANLGIYPDGWTDFSDWSEREFSDGIPLRGETFQYALFDCVGCGILLIVLILFEFRVVPDEVKKQDEELVSPADYSLMIYGVPHVSEKYARHEEYRDDLVRYFSGEFEDELKDFLNELAVEGPDDDDEADDDDKKPVATLVPLNSGRVLRLKLERERLQVQQKGLEMRLEAHQPGTKEEFYQSPEGELLPHLVSTDGCLRGFFRSQILTFWEKRKAMVELALERNELDIDAAERKMKDEDWREVIAVVVSFNKERHKDNVAAWLDKPDAPRFQGERLKVQEAPEPNGLSYENLDQNAAASRRSRLYLVAVLLVLISLIFLFILGQFIGPQPIEFQDLAPSDAWLIAPDPGNRDPRDVRFEVCEAQMFKDEACTEPIEVVNVFTRASQQTADRVVDGATGSPCARANIWTSAQLAR